MPLTIEVAMLCLPCDLRANRSDVSFLLLHLHEPPGLCFVWVAGEKLFGTITINHSFQLWATKNSGAPQSSIASLLIFVHVACPYLLPRTVCQRYVFPLLKGLPYGRLPCFPLQGYPSLWFCSIYKKTGKAA